MLGAEFSAKTDARVQHRGYTILEGFGTFAKTLREAFQSVGLPDSFLESSLDNLLRFTFCTCPVEKALKEKAGPTLWNPNSSAGDERWEKRKQNARRVLYK